MSLSRVPADMLALRGEAYTLRRETVAAGANSWTAGSKTVTYYAQVGQRRIDKENDAGGLVRDPEAVVILSPDYTEPLVGDRVSEGTLASDSGALWLEITHVDPVRVGGVVAKYHARTRA